MKCTLFAASLVLAVSAFSQETKPPAPAAAPAAPVPAAAPALPSADSVLQHYLDATGGAKAYDAVKTEVATGSFIIPAANITGTIHSYSSVPNKNYIVIELAGVGKIEEGTDGTIAWENSAMQGARIKTGDEAAAELRQSAPDLHTNWKKYYKSAEVAGTDTVNGKLCYKVILTPPAGSPETQYYDKDSGLLLKQTATYETPMGKVPTEIFLDDYRKQGDLLLPFHTLNHVAGQEFETKLDKVEINAPVEDSVFALPAEIKALQK